MCSIKSLPSLVIGSRKGHDGSSSPPTVDVVGWIEVSSVGDAREVLLVGCLLACLVENSNLAFCREVSVLRGFLIMMEVYGWRDGVYGWMDGDGGWRGLGGPYGEGVGVGCGVLGFGVAGEGRGGGCGIYSMFLEGQVGRYLAGLLVMGGLMQQDGCGVQWIGR